MSAAAPAMGSRTSIYKAALLVTEEMKGARPTSDFLHFRTKCRFHRVQWPSIHRTLKLSALKPSGTLKESYPLCLLSAGTWEDAKWLLCSTLVPTSVCL